MSQRLTPFEEAQREVIIALKKLADEGTYKDREAILKAMRVLHAGIFVASYDWVSRNSSDLIKALSTWLEKRKS